MADIKTRESLHTVKTFDRVQNLAAKTRNGVDQAKQEINDTISSGESSESEYAGNRLEAYESGIAHHAVRAGDRIGRWGVRETRRNIQKWYNRPKKMKGEAPKPKELPASKQTTLLEAPKTAAKGGSKAVQTTTKVTSQTAKGAAKTAKTTVKTTEKAAKTTAKTAKATAKVAAKAAQKAAQAAKAAAQATVKFVKVAAKAIVAAVKATVAAVKGIVAAIAAGGWVAVVVILVIVIIGGIIAAVCGVFTPNDAGSYSVVYMMSACDSEYDAKVLEIVNNTPHDYLVTEGQEAPKKDVIAVFAVLTNSTNKDFSDLNSELLDEFRAVFNTMNTVEHYTSTSEETVIREYSDAEGNPYQVEETVVKTTLHIEYTSMTASEGADVYHFNEKQREQLNTLLSSDFDELWAGILGQ